MTKVGEICLKLVKSIWQSRHLESVVLVAATISGLLTGLALQSHNLSKTAIRLIGYPGFLVLRCFRLLLIPTIVFNVILSISSLKKKKNSKIIWWTIVFFLMISAMCSFAAGTITVILRPVFLDHEQVERNDTLASNSTLPNANSSSRVLDAVLNLLRNAVPDNFISATFLQEFTRNLADEENFDDNSTVIDQIIVEHKFVPNFLGVLFISILIGISMASLDVPDLESNLQQLNKVINRMLVLFLKVLPLGIFFWMAQEGLNAGAVGDLFNVAKWMLPCIAIGLAVHQLVILPILYILLVHKNPISFHLKLLPTFLTSLGTASSSACLPVSLRCMEKVIPESVLQFVLPLGMSIHKPGVCIDLTVQVLCMAYMENVTLDFVKTVTVCVTVLILSMASPAIPSSGNPVFLLTVLATIDVVAAPAYLPVAMALFWLTDRLSTTSSVIGDCYVAAFVAALSGELDEPKKEKNSKDISIIMPKSS